MNQIYNVAPDRAFVDQLAGWILMHPDLRDDPLAMSRVRVLLPTRRGVRALHEAFLKIADGTPCILPRMDAIGGLDSEELSMLDPVGFGDAEDLLSTPSLINNHTRLLILTQLVLSAGTALAPRPGADSLDLSYQQALRLATGLAQLQDQAETEGIALDSLEELEVHAELSDHWQESLKFLKLLFDNWPDIMEQLGYISVAQQRRTLIERQTEAWQNQPPQDMVIAAGSTGSIPSTRNLLKAVLGLPKGILFLPGLDTQMADEAWDTVGHDQSHPQHNLYHLLAHCEVPRSQVEYLSETPYNADRHALLSTAFLPAAVTDQWRELEVGSFPHGLDGVIKIETADIQQEAEVIAVAMREALEEPGKTAVLITPDRDLARRVIIEVRRWGIDLDDSAGLPLKNTTLGLMFRLIAQTLAEGFSPSTLLPVLKHPYAQIEDDLGQNKKFLRQFEKAFLRGDKPAHGITGLKQAFQDTLTEMRRSDKSQVRDNADELERKLSPYLANLESKMQPLDILANGEHSMLTFLSAHVEVLNGLDRHQTIWRGASGEALAAFIDGLRDALIEETQYFGKPQKIDAKSYLDCIEALIGPEAVRQSYGLHPRLAIWGTMEGRLQQADRVILGGLNEGTWPTRTDAGPWLSRQMRIELGLPSTEKKIGLSSHDFAQAFSSSEVLITRALKSGGSETKASRLLQRLDAVVQKVGLTFDAKSAQRYLNMAKSLTVSSTESPTPIGQPMFAPPVKERPFELSVTDYETLQRDPYSIYAKHVLGLRKLDPIETNASLLDRGNLIHNLLYEFIKANPTGPLPTNAHDKLMASGRLEFEKLNKTAPGATAFWWPRYKRIVDWVITTETKRREANVSAQVEIDGKYDFGGFKIKGRADRIDMKADHAFEIIDYKTGSVPNSKQVERLEAPQLLLEALMLERSGFSTLQTEHAGAKSVDAIIYWKLTGSGHEPAKETRVSGDKLATALQGMLNDLQDKFTLYKEEHNPYIALPDPKLAPKYQAYDILVRESEWRTTSEDELGTGYEP